MYKDEKNVNAGKSSKKPGPTSRAKAVASKTSAAKAPPAKVPSAEAPPAKAPPAKAPPPTEAAPPAQAPPPATAPPAQAPPPAMAPPANPPDTMPLLQAVQQCQKDEDKIRLLQAAGSAAGPDCPPILRTFQSGTPAKREAAMMLAQKCQGITAADLYGVVREFDQSQPEEKLGVLQAFVPKLQDPQNKHQIMAAFSQQDQQRADQIISSMTRGGPPQGYPPHGAAPGYPHQQPSHGYPPQQPGHSYPPQQPGYAYPHPQPAYGYPAPQPVYAARPVVVAARPVVVAARPVVLGRVVHAQPVMVVPAVQNPYMAYNMQKQMAKQQKKMYKKSHKCHKRGFGFGSFSFSL